MFEKKIPNPKIKELEGKLKRRGFFIVPAFFYHSTVRIPDSEEWMKYLKRNGVRTVFRNDCQWPGSIFYCGILNGAVIGLSELRREIKKPKR